jgi:hypothetical protein
MSVLRRLYHKTPKSTIRAIRRRIVRPSGLGPDLDEILESPKHTRSQRLSDYLSRYERILARNIDWPSLDFDGKNVIEIGAGPVAGWAPLAVQQGCAQYDCVEPFCDPDILTRSALRPYLRGVFRDLQALHGGTNSFDEYMESLARSVTVANCTLDTLPDGNGYHIALSNSCLEHIEDLDRTLAMLRKRMLPGSRFLHLVDFGNHRPTENPFAGMYSVTPAAYREKYGPKVNLLRASDILTLFHKNGFDVQMVPYYWVHEGFVGPIHEHWKSYDEDTLFLKVALFAGSTR